MGHRVQQMLLEKKQRKNPRVFGVPKGDQTRLGCMNTEEGMEK